MRNETVQINRSRGIMWLGVAIVAMVGILLITLAVNAQPQAFETGQYATTILSSDLPEGYPLELAPLTVGGYVIDYMDDGTFVVIKDGTEVIQGRYQANPARLVMTDESGPFSCFEPGTETGVYEWSLANDTLTLTPTNDRCIARVTVLAAKPFTK